ncbi:MAG: hypothetical protein ACU0DB_10060, partial [Paracoccus sp. (in: a-proteobacteria)]|uniref:hypothetical protein n=1 Tax=Paracoccus sp. TaxID=267 RepID=UPI0040599874
AAASDQTCTSGKAGASALSAKASRILCARDIGKWLPFLNTFRTMCVAPEPDFRRLLEDIRELQIAA